MIFKNLTYSLLAASTLTVAASNVFAQSKLYPNLFDLQEVRLTDDLYSRAERLTYDVLLQYDVDRLLTPYMRQAGFTDWEAEHPNFQNWGSGSFRLDGHVGGHYLTALALAYASSSDEQVRAVFLEKVNYMVDKMAECQAVFDSDTTGLRGYIGGHPCNEMWSALSHGDMSVFDRYRGDVPIYTMHKIYAGLRDAYVYAGNEKALECFLKLCDWGINLVAKLDDGQMQSVLNTEHGGINEVYADAYALTGERKYLDAAYKYTHRMMVDGMQQPVDAEFLSGKHANTQVPKYIGFLRTVQVSGDNDSEQNKQLRQAAENFWTDVVENRTTAIGGNSIGEHFLAHRNASRHVTDTEGPESCNTNNMLKLTEDLFADAPSARLADFYENAMMNHILSTQNPHTGGYVYFTSLRPQHFRIYSQVNQGMWCCVGTGMENHSKYGEFIYSHSLDNQTLYVNLFVDSRLESEHFGLTQTTRFPFEESTDIMIHRDGAFTLALRHPAWCSEVGIELNGRKLDFATDADGYIRLNRRWKKGDQLHVTLPMQLNLVECPGYADYVALRYGPVLLAAATSADEIDGQFAGEGRMDHSPALGVQKPLTSAPMLIGDRGDVLCNVYPVDKNNLIFKIKAEQYNDPRFADLELRPFFTVHESRYMIYWCQLTSEGWQRVHEQMEAEAAAAQRLNDRTVDYVGTGEQQSDAGHSLVGSFEKGVFAGEHYIHALQNQAFTYKLKTDGLTGGLSLMCRYHSGDAGRHFSIRINGELFQNVELKPQSDAGLYNVEYTLPESLLQGRSEIEVTFEAPSDSFAGGLYGLWVLKQEE